MVKILEIANAVEPAQDARIHIEKINGRCCISMTPTEYRVGLNLAIARGLLWLHESGTLCEVHAVGCRAVRLEIGTATYGRVYQTVAPPLLVGSRRWPDIKSTKGWIPSASEGQTFFHGVMSDETAIPISFDQETCGKQRDKRQDNAARRLLLMAVLALAGRATAALGTVSRLPT